MVVVLLSKRRHYIFAFLGREKVVVLNSLEKVRETLVEKQNDFAGRPISHSSELKF